eukprot:scaffold43920_cov69-Phaeocystis_antarctica.AAC.9
MAASEPQGRLWSSVGRVAASVRRSVAASAPKRSPGAIDAAKIWRHRVASWRHRPTGWRHGRRLEH